MLQCVKEEILFKNIDMRTIYIYLLSSKKHNNNNAQFKLNLDVETLSILTH